MHSIHFLSSDILSRALSILIGHSRRRLVCKPLDWWYWSNTVNPGFALTTLHNWVCLFSVYLVLPFYLLVISLPLQINEDWSDIWDQWLLLLDLTHITWSFWSILIPCFFCFPLLSYVYHSSWSSDYKAMYFRVRNYLWLDLQTVQATCHHHTITITATDSSD